MTNRPETQPDSHRVTLPDVFMFLLEIGMWASFAWIGWQVGAGSSRWLFATAFAGAAILIWGIFRTPSMPPAGKPGAFPTPGPIRLVLEVGLFLLAGYGLWVTGYRWISETLWTFAALIYVLSFSRIRWLLDH